MVSYTEMQNLIYLQNDFTARLSSLILIGLIILVLYIYQNRLSEDKEWHRLRNFVLKYVSYGSLLFYPLFFVLMVTEGATMSMLISYVAWFYGLMIIFGGVLVWVWFYDLIIDILSEFGSKFNFRKHYIIPKRRQRK